MLRPFRGLSGNSGLVGSKLFDETTFYQAFIHDLGKCRQELVIESPFITKGRVKVLLPKLQRLAGKGIRVTINTRHPADHDESYKLQAQAAIDEFLASDIRVLFTGNHHRKLAIIDRRILWEGSINILSQADSCEIMRRIESIELVDDMIRFTKLDRFLQ